MPDSSTLTTLIRGDVSIPRLDNSIVSNGLDLAFIMFGSEAYLGSFNLRSTVTMAGKLSFLVSIPESISRLTSTLLESELKSNLEINVPSE